MTYGRTTADQLLMSDRKTDDIVNLLRGRRTHLKSNFNVYMLAAGGGFMEDSASFSYSPRDDVM